MPQFITGDLWTAETNIIAITTNAMVRADGALVMGRGAAKEAAERYPKLPYVAGKRIVTTCGSRGFYGWMTFSRPDITIGLFQVKYSWQENADPGLIERSVEALNTWLTQDGCEYITVALNYPGIGNGRLKEAQVAPLLAALPDRVTIYRLPATRREGGRG